MRLLTGDLRTVGQPEVLHRTGDPTRERWANILRFSCITNRDRHPNGCALPSPCMRHTVHSVGWTAFPQLISETAISRNLRSCSIPQNRDDVQRVNTNTFIVIQESMFGDCREFGRTLQKRPEPATVPVVNIYTNIYIRIYLL